MKPPVISVLTICGIEELPGHEAREVTHVLSLLDPGWPELAAFQGYGPHHRPPLHFNDIIEAVAGRIAPTSEDVAEILRFGDRQSFVEGKGGYVRVDLGGRRTIKTTTKT